MDLHLRLQHGVLFLAATAALFTGMTIGSDLLAGTIPFDLRYRLHRWSGLTAAAVVAYHILYLFVRGYVEGRNWATFPLAWKRGDRAMLGGDLSYFLGRIGARPEAGTFRPAQKLFYWTSGILLIALALSGLSIASWEAHPLAGILRHLALLASLHRGLALLLLAILAWHLYGAFVWEGRPAPQWTWLTGSMPEAIARSKVTGFYREHRSREEERLAAMKRKSAEEAEEEEWKADREHVEEDLREGNRLAKEEKFVEALYHYRRALERYPAYSQARYNMAVVLQKMGERAMALENFRQFLNDDPFHPLAEKAQEFIREIEGEKT